MSKTFEMLCKDCEESYWFGQTSSGVPFMYKPQKFMDWLAEHTGHEMFVMDDNTEWPEWYDYDTFKTISYDGVQE